MGGSEVLAGLLGVGIGLAIGYMIASAASEAGRERVTEFILDEQGRVVGMRTYYRA